MDDKKKKKVRPRLKPISTTITDNSFGGNSDDGLGFGHILTPGEVTTNSKDEDENIGNGVSGGKTSEETLHASKSVALPELSPREPSPQQSKSSTTTPEAALSSEKRQTVTTVNGIDCMTQYSSITNPSTATTPSSAAVNGGAVNNLDQLSFLHAEISLESSRDDGVDNVGEGEEEGEGVNKSTMIGNELSPIKVSSTNNEVVNVQKDQLNTSDDDDVSVASSESSSSSSSSSSEEESEASDLPTPIDNSNETSQLQELQSEISSRQRLLSKLLRGKEGSLYASLVQEQEEMVNSQLLSGKDDASKTSSSSPTALQRIKSILVDEYYHTLPGAFSLIIHCLLYVTVYAIISKSLTKLCDVTIIYFTGWDANVNWFDSTNHELVFYAIVLFFSLVAARLTGVIFDWNENRMYQKRVAFQVRNKWYMKCFDTKLMDYFHEGALSNKYDTKKNDSGTDKEAVEGREARQSKKKKWGPKIKYVLDLFSFFICYKCVDSFVSTYMYLGSEITDSVLQNLPSRQLQEERDAHLVATGFSYACPSVTSALDNPYAKDMLNWIASLEIESEEAKNWLTNAKKCGWSSEMDKVEVHSDLEEEKEEEEEDDEEEEEEDASPTFLRQRRIMSAQDDKYLQATISREAYYDLVGDPRPRFFDPDKEMFFLLTSTTVCFGLLYAFGIPFLLI